MRPEVRRRVFVALVTFAVIGLITYGFIPKQAPVDVTKASRGPLRVVVEEEGKTRVTDRYVISAPVAGYMRRIVRDVGDPVRKGEIVVELEPVRSGVLDPRARAEAEAVVSAARANLNAARERGRAASADEEYARQRQERGKALFAKGFISRDELEQTASDAARTTATRLAAEAAVKAAQADVNRALSTLGNTPAEGAVDKIRVVAVKSPVDGRLLKKHHESEAAVNAGEPIVDVGDPRRLEVWVEVLSADAVNIRPGTLVFFERWGGGDALWGKARTVEPTAFTKISSLGVEEQRVFVVADITSIPESWQRLGDGYRVEASFIIWEGKDVLQVPAGALFRKGEDWAVFIMEGGRAHVRIVKAGHRNGFATEILSGLKEGDRVISHPGDTVSDGARVKPR